MTARLKTTTSFEKRRMERKRLLNYACQYYIQKKRINQEKKPILIKKKPLSFSKFSIKFPKIEKKQIKLPSLPKGSFFELVSDVLRSFWLTARYYPIQAITIMAFAGAIFSATQMLYQNIFQDLPHVEQLSQVQPNLTTRILDRNGNLLYKIYEDENRTFVPLAEIPPQMIFATIAIEDSEFFRHFGFSVRGISRALFANLKGEQVQGGSTITQQLVKNRLLSPERTMSRKIKELILSIMVEQTYSKEQILEMYLNQVAYGGSTYGVEEAAQRYFGKSVRNITLAESTLLAGLPAAPSVYNPFGPNPELATQRQEEVLRRMVEDGYITQEDADKTSKVELTYRQDSIDIQAPHFVMYIRRILAEEYGEDVLNRGGLEVVTTLDLDVQNQAQEIVSKEVENLTRLHITNGAALITNPQTGEILAMVGSADYYDFEHDGQVNVTIRPRQPGSSIKPLTYLTALENGYSPSSLIDDTFVTYQIPGSPPYSPKNYDGKFHGRVTMREALASSYNIPAVKILAGLGVDKLLDKGEELGITTWKDRSRFGLSLTLGGGEVMMTEMAQLYGALANGGKLVKMSPIISVTNSQGKVLYKNQCLDEIHCDYPQVIKPGVAYLITSILSDNVARTPAFGPLSVLNIPNQQVAVKTGTTNNLRDNWTIGYTTDRLVAVWVGNNDNTPMSYVASGVTGASPIWNKIMRSQLDANQPHQFAQPDSVIKVAICSPINTLPCRGCPKVKEEYFLIGSQPQVSCGTRYFTRADQQTPNTNSNRDRILNGSTF